MGLTIEYDSSCPGQGCFEDYPCRYVDSAAALAQVKIVPNTTADCYKVPNINTGLTIEYDSSCPGQGCFEDYPCRYVDSAAALAQFEDCAQHHGGLLQGAEHQHRPDDRVRLVLPGPGL